MNPPQSARTNLPGFRHRYSIERGIMRLIVLLTAALASGAASVSAQSPPCDENRLALTDSTSPLRYMARGSDRCEGLFLEKVSRDTPFFLAGLVRFAVFDPGSGEGPVTISWPDTAADGGPVRLRVESIQRGFYYQMDALAESGRPFEWSAEIPSQLSKTSRELTVSAWRDPVGEQRERVYLPVVASQGEAITTCEYRVVLWTDNVMRDLRLQVSDPATAEVVFDGPAGTRSLYRGGQAAIVRLGVAPEGLRDEVYLQEPGRFRARVTGETLDSTSLAVDFLFDHAGFAPTCFAEGEVDTGER